MSRKKFYRISVTNGREEIAVYVVGNYSKKQALADFIKSYVQINEDTD